MNAAAFKVNNGRSVKSLDIAKFNGNHWEKITNESCDMGLLSGGWSPILHLLSHRGVRPIWNEENSCFIAGKHNEPITMAGSAAGFWDTVSCIASGEANGLCAAEILGKKIKR